MKTLAFEWAEFGIRLNCARGAGRPITRRRLLRAS